MRALAGLLLTAGGCDPRGAIEVSWTLGGVAPDGDPLVCASHGIDAVWIAATDPGTEDVSAEGVLPCKDGAGSVGDIAPGEVDVHVFGLAPSYRRLTTAEPARLVAIEDDGRRRLRGTYRCPPHAPTVSTPTPTGAPTPPIQIAPCWRFACRGEARTTARWW